MKRTVSKSVLGLRHWLCFEHEIKQDFYEYFSRYHRVHDYISRCVVQDLWLLFKYCLRVTTFSSFSRLGNFSAFEESVGFVIIDCCAFLKMISPLIKRREQTLDFSLSICVFMILRTKLNSKHHFKRKKIFCQFISEC